MPRQTTLHLEKVVSEWTAIRLDRWAKILTGEGEEEGRERGEIQGG